MSAARLREALQACSTSFETGDLAESDGAVAGAVSLLDSLADSPPPDAEDALAEIHRFLSSDGSNQTAVDALALELPKVVIRFVNVSDKCEDIVRSVIGLIVSISNPRDMLSVLCEALDTSMTVYRAPMHYALLLNKLSEVLLRIQRHQIEQVKVVLPVILKLLNAVSADADEGNDEHALDHLFREAFNIGASIQRICEELEGRRKQELCAILGLYSLENIAFLSRSRESCVSSSRGPHIVRFSKFIRFCGLSYYGLITGSDFKSITGDISKVDGDDFASYFPFAKDGASLVVIWGFILNEVTDAVGEQLDTTLNDMRGDFSKRWQAIGMLKSTLSSIHYPWEIKSYSVDIILSIMDGYDPKESYNSSTDFSSFVPTIYAVLKGIERIIIYAPDASSRKKYFDALKKVLSNIPCTDRFDILKAVIANNDSPSMMAILIDIVKNEMHGAYRQKNVAIVNENPVGKTGLESSPFSSHQVLDVVELVLKPMGGPPPLPEHWEPVLSVLNLYRFAIILESSGRTNQTGVLSQSTLQKAYSDWLLPLRTVTMAMQAQHEKDGDEVSESILCALAPVQLVLHRCIELVEEKLKL